MSKGTKKKLSCAKCISYFGSTLGRFNTKFAFKIHTATAHKVNGKRKPFKCGYCDYSYSDKSNLNKHLASLHEWIKPFKCDSCDYKCSQNSTLNHHVATVHEGKKPFKCDSCDYTCARKSTLNRHVTAVHEGKKKF